MTLPISLMLVAPTSVTAAAMTATFQIHAHRFLALFDHLAQDRQDVGIGDLGPAFTAQRNLAVLDRARNQAQA